MQSAPLPDFSRVIPDIFSKTSLNYMVGGPNSGKSAILLSALERYHLDGTFLGFPAPRHNSLPQIARCGYLACERSADQTAEAMHAIVPDLTIDLLPTISLESSGISRGTSSPLDDLYELFPTPRPQFLIIEAMQMLMCSGKIMDYHEVADFCVSLRQFCKRRHVTILGTLPTAKTTSGEDYRTPTPLGSVAWLHNRETELRLELVDAALPESQQSSMRKLTIVTRWGPHIVQYYDFDDCGKLVPAIEPTDWRTALAKRLQAVPLGEPIARAVFVAWGQTLGVQRTMVDGWLAQCVEESMLERVKQGTYRRPYQT